MPAVLVRIDDRLLHGQVLVAWAQALRPDRIVLASDEVAGDPLRRAVYATLPQEDYEVVIETLEEAARDLRGTSRGGKRVLFVCGSPAEARRLHELGAQLSHLNVGGLHYGEAKKQLLAYVFLSRQDVDDLRLLMSRGVEVEARDLPGSRGVRLDGAALERLWS
jgi:mannose/fructose/N-acetylgalactosamine-specific phosphotransferase system component IIB